ncbi:hypothetical protein LP421_30880 (plasmid) [Rhizobium sp. RCAM05350]|nr:hypothetical protein LP421_30880 [Rhizobium sp. RCAM05350]
MLTASGASEDALALSQQLKLSDDYAANAVQAAAAGHLGRADNARMAFERLGAGRADFNVTFRKSMSARHFTPEMSDLLEIGVLKATAQKS